MIGNRFLAIILAGTFFVSGLQFVNVEANEYVDNEYLDADGCCSYGIRNGSRKCNARPGRKFCRNSGTKKCNASCVRHNGNYANNQYRDNDNNIGYSDVSMDLDGTNTNFKDDHNNGNYDNFEQNSNGYSQGQDRKDQRRIDSYRNMNQDRKSVPDRQGDGKFHQVSGDFYADANKHNNVGYQDSGRDYGCDENCMPHNDTVAQGYENMEYAYNGQNVPVSNVENNHIDRSNIDSYGYDDTRASYDIRPGLENRYNGVSVDGGIQGDKNDQGLYLDDGFTKEQGDSDMNNVGYRGTAQKNVNMRSNQSMQYAYSDDQGMNGARTDNRESFVNHGSQNYRDNGDEYGMQNGQNMSNFV